MAVNTINKLQFLSFIIIIPLSQSCLFKSPKKTGNYKQYRIVEKSEGYLHIMKFEFLGLPFPTFSPIRENLAHKRFPFYYSASLTHQVRESLQACPPYYWCTTDTADQLQLIPHSQTGIS